MFGTVTFAVPFVMMVDDKGNNTADQQDKTNNGVVNEKNYACQNTEPFECFYNLVGILFPRKLRICSAPLFSVFFFSFLNCSLTLTTGKLPSYCCVVNFSVFINGLYEGHKEGQNLAIIKFIQEQDDDSENAPVENDS